MLFLPVAQSAKNTWNGGGGGIHTRVLLKNRDFFTLLFTVWKHQTLLLQHSGYN